MASRSWAASAFAACVRGAPSRAARQSPALTKPVLPHPTPASSAAASGTAAARDWARRMVSSSVTTFPSARKFTSREVGTALASVRSSSTVAGHSGAARLSLLTRARELLGDYKQLSKLRLSLLVVSTAAGGYVLGSPEAVDWTGLGWVSLGTLGAAASANTLNQIYEIKLDALMKRTMNRPLPSGRVSRPHALAFALFTGLGGTALLAAKTNLLTAELGLANIFLYAAIYTPLKTVSIINTWVGAVVGAVPPLMGWTAASGALSPGAAALGAVLYWWQMPHFMALAWMCKADYGAGGYRMLSLVDATGRRTAACALRNCVYLMPLGILAVCLGVTTDAFAFENALLSGGMAATATVFYQSPSQATARMLFRASLLHLPLIMAAMMLHRVPNYNLSTAELEQRLKDRFVKKEPVISDELSLPAFSVPAPFPFLPLPTGASISQFDTQREIKPNHQPTT